MKIEWTIIAVTALISGGSAGVAVGSDEATEPLTVTVGEMRIGDHAVYYDANHGYVEIFGPAAERWEWAEDETATRLRMAVTGVEQVHDGAGRLRDAVVTTREDEANGRIELEYISLAGGYLVATGFAWPNDYTGVFPGGGDLGFPWGFTFGQTELTVGEDLTANALRFANHVRAAEGEAPVGEEDGLDEHLRVTVVGGATWDGQEAVGIQVLHEEYWTEYADRWISTTTEWFVDGVPVPVHIEERAVITWGLGEGHDPIEGYRDPGIVEYTWNKSLETFTPGTTPVGWTDGLAPLHTVPWAELPRHPLVNGHPVEGNLRVDYGLEQAIAAVESDPLLTSYQDWRQEHPDGVVLAAAYSQFSNGPAWTLTYGEEQAFLDDASKWFSVRSMQGPLGIVVNSDQVPTEEGIEPGGWTPSRSVLDSLDATISLADADHVARHFIEAADWEPGPVALAFGDNAGSPWVSSSVLPDLEYTYGQQRVQFMYADQDNPDFVTTVLVGLSEGSIVSVARMARPTEIALDEAFPDPLPPAEQGTAPAPPRNTLNEGAITVAVAAGVISLLTLFGVVVRAAFMFGHAKIYGERVLQHPLRRTLMNLIDAEPGMSTTDLHRRLAGCTVGTIIYHLDVMRREGYIRRLGGIGQRRWVPVKVGAVAAEQAAVLKSHPARRVYEYVRGNPGAGRAAVADAQSTTLTAVSRHLERLRAVGLLDRKREGRGFSYFAHQRPAGAGAGR